MAVSRAYFDYAASTPLDPVVRRAMEPYLERYFGNPNSVHQFGREALTGIDRARAQSALFLHCQPAEVVFTAGATEANNLAILGSVTSGDHVITTVIEHPSVLEPCRYLEQRGVEVTYLPVESNGIIELKDVEAALQENTRLVSIMYVNNEIGTIQPIEAVGELIAAVNRQRLKKRQPVVLFHTDAVQAATYCPMDVSKLSVDLLTLSAHKIHGPKGAGLLYRKSNVNLEPRQYGGNQEFGLRPGTPDAAAIVGLGEATAMLANKNYPAAIRRIADLQRAILLGLKKQFKSLPLNGDAKRRIAGNIHLSFPGIDGQSLLMLLDQAGVAISVGAACSAGSLAPSPVVRALGLSADEAAGSIRISFGRFTTDAEVGQLLGALSQAVARLR